MYYLTLAIDDAGHPIRAYSTEDYKTAKEFTLQTQKMFPKSKLLKVIGEVTVRPMNPDKLQENTDESSSSL